MPELMGDEGINWDTFEIIGEETPASEAVEPEETVEAPDESADVAPEDTAQEDQGRPRDPETGQFVSAEQETAEEQEERLYAGKYKSVEELERALLEAQSFTGRQSTEVGELRQQMAELVESLNRPAPFQSAPVDIDSVIADAGFYEAAEMTAARQDWNAHNRVLAEWQQIDADQVGVYKLSKQSQFEAQQAREQAALLERQTQQQTQSSAIPAAYARLQAEFPDLETLLPMMGEEASEAQRLAGQPVYTPMIESGDPDKAYFALRTLATLARARVPGQQQQAAVDLARTAAVETQRAKEQAMVASATGAAPPPPPPKTYDDELLDEFKAQDVSRDGWHIGGY